MGGAITVSTSVIELRFNKILKEADYSKDLITQSTEFVHRVETRANKLYLYTSALSENNTYSFSLKHVVSKDGEVIDNINLSFTAKAIASDRVSKDQEVLEATLTDRDEINDPILYYLPHKGDGFYLQDEFVAKNNNYALVINAQLILTRADIISGIDQAEQLYKKKVEDYIRSKGLDPAKYSINYIVNVPPDRSGNE